MKYRFLITSGPTQEPLDPVRYLSNYSTGVMGRCLAQAAKKRGHKVTWVQCPKDAQSARDLLKKLSVLLPKHDVLIMAAAVADVRPAVVSRRKLKKDGLKSIRLVENPDILAALSRKKRSGQVFVGFGLESEKIVEYGAKKLAKKNLELIILQEVTEKMKPFGNTSLKAWLVDKKGLKQIFSTVTKPRLAGIVIRQAEQLLAKMA